MNCRNARRLMDDILDGNAEERTHLDDHLQTCSQCRLEWSRLKRIADALTREADRPVEEASLDHLAERVSAAVRAQRAAAQPPVRPRAWAMAAAIGAAALVFALGVGTGRSLWPREVVVTEVVTKTEVVEKPVEVPAPFPVVEERVVEKPVPVYRTKVVYRDRPMEVAARLQEAEHEPERARGTSAPPVSDLVASPPVVWREIAPASLAVQGAKPLPPPGPPAPSEPPDPQGEQRGAAPDAVLIARTNIPAGDSGARGDHP